MLDVFLHEVEFDECFRIIRMVLDEWKKSGSTDLYLYREYGFVFGHIKTFKCFWTS